MKNRLICSFALWLPLSLALAQTNVTLSLTDNSLLNGTLVADTKSNVVVSIDGVNQTFATDKIRWQERKVIHPPANNVPDPVSAGAGPTITPATTAPAPGQDSLSPENRPGSQSPASYVQALENVRQQVIQPHQQDAFKEMKNVAGHWQLVTDPDSKAGAERYQQANHYYDQTMPGVINGSINQDELIRQARTVLADCDKYKAERQNDPQYEQQIATLREFVRRSEAGEKFDFTPAP